MAKPLAAGMRVHGNAWHAPTFREQLSADEMVTVGPGGDFANINAALSALAEKYPIYLGAGYNVEVRLLEGFTVAEQIFVNGVDLGWIRITSAEPVKPITAFANGGAGFTIVTIAGHGYSNGDVVRIVGTTNYNGFWNVSTVATNTFGINTDFVADDATGTCKRGVNIQRSALTTTSPVDAPLAPFLPAYPFLLAYASAVLPRMDVLFNMDTSGPAAGRNGCILASGSHAHWHRHSGIMNAGTFGIVVWQGSTAFGATTCWKYAGNRAIYVVGASTGYFPHSHVSGSLIGLACDGGSVCDAMRIFADDCTEYGLFLTGSARVQAIQNAGAPADGSISRCGIDNIYVGNSSTLHARNMICTDAAQYNVHCVHNSGIQICDADLRNAGVSAIRSVGAFVDALGSDVSGAGVRPYVTERGGVIVNRYGYRTGPGLPLSFSSVELGALANGQLIRVRLRTDETCTIMVTASFAGHSDTVGTRNNSIKTVITMVNGVAGFAEISRTLLHNNIYVDADVPITHTGADRVFDIDVQHPAAHVNQLANWYLELDIVCFEHWHLDSVAIV